MCSDIPQSVAADDLPEDYPDTFEISRQQNDDGGYDIPMNCNQYRWLDEDKNAYMYRNIGKSQKNITEDGHRLDKPTLIVRCGKKSRWKKETKMCPETVRQLNLRRIQERVADKTGAMAELLDARAATNAEADAAAEADADDEDKPVSGEGANNPECSAYCAKQKRLNFMFDLEGCYNDC